MAKKKTEFTNGLIGAIIGAAVVLVFMAFLSAPNSFGYKTTQLSGMHSAMAGGGQAMPSTMMHNMMMGNSMMPQTQHTDANNDGKCDMCGMRLDDCKRMMGGI